MVTAHELLDPPRRVRPSDIAQRYGITERLAGDWIRAMKAAGVIATIGNVSVARLSACDAWVASGGAVANKTRKRSMRGVTLSPKKSLAQDEQRASATDQEKANE